VKAHVAKGSGAPPATVSRSNRSLRDTTLLRADPCRHRR
jgi:hypothetical protein